MSIYYFTYNCIDGLREYTEMADVMGLFMPRYVLLIAGKDDEVFLISATRKAFKDLLRIYRAGGAELRYHFVVGACRHHFYTDDACPIML